ncbi:MAG: Gldg family protein [Clostridia bacterium]|nr:Gldg family protein [Clostridia bacterium]
MNNKTNKKFSSKKFKYGTSAAVFTIVFVIFIILINVLLSYIDSRNGGFYVDMTTEQLYGVSDASVAALSAVDKPVEIIFCSHKDKLTDVDVLNPIVMLAESYEKTFDNVSVVYKDKLSDVAYFDKFKKTSTDELNLYSIIVNSPSTGLSKIYNWDDMYKLNTEGALFAFDGEYKLTSAILATARNDEDMLSAGLVTGHGENTHLVKHFLEDFGYNVSEVDLKLVSDKELATYDLLLVCNPRVDFIGMEKKEIEAAEKTEETQVQAQNDVEANAVSEEADVAEENKENGSALVTESKSVNEIRKLRDYVTESYGNLFLFFDPNGANMPELFSLAEDGFGVRLSNMLPIYDYKESLTNTTQNSQEDWRFLGYYSTETESEGYKMHKGISESGTGIKPAFGISCLMNIPKSQVGSMSISPIVTSSENAIVWVENEFQAVPYVPLMTLSKYTKLVDSKEYSGNAVISASSSFLNELDNPSFANADLFKNMLSKMGNSYAALDIDFKVLDESTIEVTTADADGMMKKLAIVIPVIIAVAGIAVFIKRKYL